MVSETNCPGKRGAQSSSRGRVKKGHLNWKGADTQAVRPPLRMFSKSARKFTRTKVKSAVISRRQGQPQVRTRKWGACQQKTLQRTGSWSSYWVRRSAWWLSKMKSRWQEMLNLQAIQRHRQIVVVLRYVNLTGHRTRRWQWWYQCGLGAGKWWLWWTQQCRSLSCHEPCTERGTWLRGACGKDAVTECAAGLLDGWRHTWTLWFPAGW